MTRRVRHVSDLPTWFHLEKYAGAESLGTIGWYEQLAARRELMALITSPPWQSEEVSGPFYDDSMLNRALETIRGEPIADISGNNFLGNFLECSPQRLKNAEVHRSLGVHLVTVRDLYMAEWSIEGDKQKYARQFFSEIAKNPWGLREHGYKNWIDKPVDAISKRPGFDVNIRVNLSLPDKVLVDQFIHLLDSLRDTKTHWVAPPLRKPDFSKWIRFSVLPYIDLKIWEGEADVTIPNRVMADAIFQPGEGGEEVVRKTTSDLADELLSERHLDTLRALAAREIAERNPSQLFPE